MVPRQRVDADRSQEHLGALAWPRGHLVINPGPAKGHDQDKGLLEGRRQVNRGVQAGESGHRENGMCWCYVGVESHSSCLTFPVFSVTLA